MSHDGALPVIKLRVLLNERTDCEWITLDSCSFAELETASLHFPISPPYLQHALFGYEAISTSITRKVISCSGTFVQLSENGCQRCWPWDAMGWACGIDEVGCLHRCGWILQYLGVWRNHLGTGKVQNSKTRLIFQIWTKVVFTRSQDPELIPPRLLVMLADNWSCCRWVVQLQWKVAKSPVSSDASVPKFPRWKLLELPEDSFRLPLCKSFQMSDLNVDSVDCQSHLPGSSTSHSMCKTCDQDSWWNLEAEVLKNEAALILLTRPPTAHILGKCRVHLLFLRKKPQYLVHNSATGWVQQNCLDC